MPQPTYATQVIVLRKTKLSESDLILTCLQADGELLRLIAKGARKPSSQFSSRLELYSRADILAAKGRSLDIVKEARLVEGYPSVRSDLTASSCAGAMCEFIAKTAQEGLENEVLYRLLTAALDHLSDASDDAALALLDAFLLKAFAFNGNRPNISQCVFCGSEVLSRVAECSEMWISVEEGGVVCESCHAQTSYLRYRARTLRWAQALLKSTFDDVMACAIAREDLMAIAQLCQEWSKHHFMATIKSLNFLLSGEILI